MYFLVPLQSPLQRCPPIRQVKYGPSPPTRQRGQRWLITFSILHYRSRPPVLHSKVWTGASAARTAVPLSIVNRYFPLLIVSRVIFPAADAAHQDPVDLLSPLSTVTTRYLCISKSGKATPADSCGIKVTFALDYRIRWDYIVIRGRVQSGSS